MQQPDPAAIADPALPEALATGYRRFRSGRYQAEQAPYRRLETEGQRPRTMVIALL